MSSFETAKGIAQMLIQEEGQRAALTREIIADVVDRVLGMSAAFRDGVDRDRLIAELEAQFSVWIGREATLSDNEDHVSWLNAERKQGWALWPRYRLFLEERWAEASIDALDHTTDRVLGLLEDPEREQAWDRRGLVVGHVQSGKTANYTGLICKAADAGYTVIIVLAGLHNNLRSQTQLRMDEGFLGYDSLSMQSGEGTNPIGVGLFNPSIRPDTVTNRSDSGDFNRRVANNFGINPGRLLLFVVKKNARVLRNLLDWVRWASNSRDPESGRPIVVDVPLLVIDDEADNASVDTGQQQFDQDGQPDEDHDPTRINGLIRQILFSFEKSAYVGYTATPFANIFIHERGSTAEHGSDLFPRSFLINLPAPSNYAGPVRIFGLENDENGEPRRPLPLVRHINDHATGDRTGWVPPRHRNGHQPIFDGLPQVPRSLSDAIQSFVLSIAARRARGQTSQHNSMLIHVTRFTNVQAEVRRQVEEELQRISRRLRLGEGAGTDTVHSCLRRLWEEDYVPTTAAVLDETGDPSISAVSWEYIEPHVTAAAEDIRIKEINGTSGDVLEYENNRETGLNAIVIGGDKLSRGLTLEGLTVSYFLRASRMYDTLMQMGRWFGYRPGFLDLCRLYTTHDLHDWFEHITLASEELRQEFDHMAAAGGTPRDYGLKVQTHPALMVTSRVKMRNGMDMQLSYAGSISETTVFHRVAEIVRRNFEAAEQLVQRLGTDHESNASQDRPGGRAHRWRGSLVWSDVPHEEILAFLDAVVTHPDAPRANAGFLREFIDVEARVGELTNWTVALLSGEGRETRLGRHTVSMVQRGVKNPEDPPDDRYVIRRLLAPRDEGLDIGTEAYQAALDETVREWQVDPGRYRRQSQPSTPSGPSLRRQRPSQRGLLLLYPLEPEHVEGQLPVVGFGISFPTSQNAGTVRYRVNNVYWQQEVEDVT